MESMEIVDVMEGQKWKLLNDQEETWHLKSHAVQLEAKDDNSFFSQNFTKGGKMSNTIQKYKTRKEIISHI